MKKIFKIASFTILFSTLSLTANATMPTPPPPQAQQEVQAKPQDGVRMNPKEIQERFNQLTDEQKAEITQIMKELQGKQIELLRKYAEFGLITEEEAQAMEEALTKSMEKHS